MGHANMDCVTKLTADIVVVGAGLAGFSAALEAKRCDPSADVVLLEKGTAGSSGQSVFAAGVFNVFFPDRDDRDGWTEEMILRGEFLNHQAWVRQYLDNVWDAAMNLDEIGRRHGLTVFERDVEGQLIRRKSRGHIQSFHCVYNSIPSIQALRAEAMVQGIRIINRTMALRVIESDDGVGVDGVLAVNVRTADLVLVSTPVVILAASGSGFKSVFVGHHNITGEMQREALRIGCQLVNMDKTYGNTGSRQHDIHGLNLMVGSRGRFINGLGEEFMWAYDHLGSRARLQDLVIAFAREVREGRGPIFMDLRAVSPEDQDLMRRILPETFRTWDAAGIDPFAKPIPWISAYFGTRSAGGGVRITTDCDTTVPGVLAAGDITDEPVHGTYSFGGVNVAFAAVSGKIAGHRSQFWRTQREAHVISNSRLATHVEAALAPLNREPAVEPTVIIRELQEVLIREVGFVRDAHSLSAGLARIEDIRELASRVGAQDPHHLMLAHEATGMVSLAESMLRSALVREESRGFHFRTDFPYSDNDRWLRWVLCRETSDGRIETSTEDIPMPYVRPATERHRPPGMRDAEARERGLDEPKANWVDAS